MVLVWKKIKGHGLDKDGLGLEKLQGLGLGLAGDGLYYITGNQ